jgi:hypothetical protein
MKAHMSGKLCKGNELNAWSAQKETELINLGADTGESRQWRYVVAT